MHCFLAMAFAVQGGLGGEPGNEAHGGYTFCGLAALVLLNETRALDISRLEAWLVQRQAAIEGGFNGRTNKLADGCYSFWQGAAFSLLKGALTEKCPIQSCDSDGSSHHVEREEGRWDAVVEGGMEGADTDIDAGTPTGCACNMQEMSLRKHIAGDTGVRHSPVLHGTMFLTILRPADGSPE